MTIRKVMFWIRWWHWFLVDSPNPVRLIMNGVDPDIRKMIYDRHLAREPKE